MKTRIISAVVGTVLLLAFLLCPYTVVFAVGMASLAAMAVWELLKNTGAVKTLGAVIVSMVFAVSEVALFYEMGQEGAVASFLREYTALLLMGGAVAFGIIVVFLSLLRHEELTAVQAGYTVFATAYAATGFATLAALRGTASHGLFFTLLAMIIPWMSDTGAYFVGTFFGKHKMTPVISPKKSWEGFFGGWIISVLSVVAVGYINSLITEPLLSLWELAGIAFVLAPLSVCGDLFASIIKRQCGIKDYSNLMPGHGGVMDRFDSVILIAPLLYLAVRIL